MPATPSWLGSAEVVLNRNIDSSTPAGDLARRLQGKSLQIEVAGVARIRARAGAGHVALTAGDDSPADAVVAGSPFALLQMMTGAVRPDAHSSAQVRGDAEVAARFRELLSLARPDLEEELSRLIGDLPARRLAALARGAAGWLRDARRTVGANLAEYLQEESRDLVNRSEVDEFLHDVDDLRESADRLDARLALLERGFKGAR